MSFYSASHTHTLLVDGRNTMQEMIAAAKQFRFVSLGFSEHAWQGFDFAYCMPKDALLSYVQAVKSLQQAEASPRIWCGLEIDSLVPKEAFREQIRMVDYYISSTHYLPHPKGEEPICVDGNPERILAYIRQYLAGDTLAFAKAYFDLHVDTLLRRRPNIIGHFDLLRKYAEPYALFDVNDIAYRKIALHALERAFPCGGILEVNTGAIARGTMHTPYPTMALLCAWREMGGAITLNSDCHHAPDLQCWYSEALQMIRNAGFRSVKRLGTGTALWEDIEL